MAAAAFDAWRLAVVLADDELGGDRLGGVDSECCSRIGVVGFKRVCVSQDNTLFCSVLFVGVSILQPMHIRTGKGEICLLSQLTRGNTEA